MNTEELHLAASKYASSRKEAYIQAMKKGVVNKMSEKQLNERWLAHYEGYREGFWVATENDFTTDPEKLKEKNT